MLLDSKGVHYSEIAVDMDMQRRKEMVELSGRTSVPQIFIDNRHIGGFDDMAEMDIDGELDKLLGLE